MDHELEDESIKNRDRSGLDEGGEAAEDAPQHDDRDRDFPLGVPEGRQTSTNIEGHVLDTHILYRVEREGCDEPDLEDCRDEPAHEETSQLDAGHEPIKNDGERRRE